MKSLKAILGLDKSAFEKGLKSVRNTVGKLGKKLKTSVKAGAAAAGAAIALFAKNGISDFVSFEKGMSEVFTLIPNASAEMREKLTKDIRELSKAFGTDLGDNVKALYQALSAGIPPENAIDFLAEASKAAIAGVATLEESTAALTTVLNGYGMEAKEAGKVSDILFTTVKNGVTTFPELAANVGKVTPLAAALGVEFETVGAMFAQLTKTLGSGKTAEAGTQIRNMLAELSDGSKKAGKSFEKLAGQSFAQFIANGGNVSDALRILNKEAEKNGVTLKDMFSSIEAGQAALALGKDNATGLSTALKDMKDSAGATNAAFLEMDGTSAAKFNKRLAALKDAGIEFGESLMPLANQFLPMVTAALGMLSDKFSQGSNESSTFSKTLDGIGFIFKLLIKILVTLGAGLANSIDYIFQVGKTWKTVGEIVLDLIGTAFKPLIEVISQTGDVLAAFLTAMQDPFDVNKWKDFKKVGQETISAIGDVFEQIPQNLADFTTRTGDKLKQAGSDWSDFADRVVDRQEQVNDAWSESGDWAFLDTQKLKKSAEEMDGIAAASIKAGKAGEKAADAAEDRADAEKLAAANASKASRAAEMRAASEARAARIAEAQKAAQKKLANLGEKREAIAAAIKQKQEQINEELKKEVSIHDKALGLVGKMLDKKGLDVKQRKELEQIEKRLEKARQARNDATDEGLANLKDEKAALELIMETEKKAFMEREKREGAGRMTREKHWKEHKNKLSDVRKMHESINRRIAAAEGLLQKRNKAADKMNIQTKDADGNLKEMNLTLEEGNKTLKEIDGQMAAISEYSSELDVEARGFDSAPEKMKEAKAELEDFNKLAGENPLVQLATGEIDLSSVEMKPFKEMNSSLKTHGKELRGIRKALEGKFVNQ